MAYFLIITGLFTICLGFCFHYYSQFGDFKRDQDIGFREFFLELRLSWATLWVWIIMFCGMSFILRGLSMFYG
jgi:hypothetical protein